MVSVFIHRKGFGYCQWNGESLENSGTGGSLPMQHCGDWRYSSIGHASAMSNKPDNEMIKPGPPICRWKYWGYDSFKEKRIFSTKLSFHCLNSKISSFRIKEQ